MDQALLDYYLKLGELTPEQEAIARKEATVEHLRAGGAMPGLRSDPGGYKTAAHPLEFLGALAHTGAAAYGDKQAGDMRDAYGKKRRGALDDYRIRSMPGGVGGGGAVDPNTGLPLENY